MIKLMPLPRKIKIKESFYNISRGQWIILKSNFSSCFHDHTINFIKEIQYYFINEIQISDKNPQKDDIFLVIRQKKGFPPEGYQLFPEDHHITLEASDEAGAFYGLQTLSQYICQAGSNGPHFNITDYPAFSHRGVMLDISRCKVPKISTLKELIRIFAGLKMNQIQLYTEHTFAFSEHQRVWADSSPLTSGDIPELQQYARDHYIELVPNLNSFGHFERWLCYPEYHHLAECPKGFIHESGEVFPWGTTLIPEKKSIAFLDSLYNEFLPLFTSSYFNGGCDETWELGKGRSKALCDKNGMVSVYRNFLLEIYNLSGKYGKRLMFWADIILKQPDLLSSLPEDIIPLVWGYEKEHPFEEQTRLFHKRGLDYYVCPGTSSWNSLLGRTSNSFGNLENSALNGMNHGARGYLITDWGDKGHHQYLPVSFPGFAAGAAQSWNPGTVNETDVIYAIDHLIFNVKTGSPGKLLLDLGKIHEKLPFPVANESIFNRLLFSRDTPFLTSLPPALLEQTLEKFLRLEEQLSEIRLVRGDRTLLKNELKNGMAMAELGIRKALHYSGKKEPDRLKNLFNRVLEDHGNLWLKRNRPGGLIESKDFLKKAFSDFDL